MNAERTPDVGAAVWQNFWSVEKRMEQSWKAETAIQRTQNNFLSWPNFAALFYRAVQNGFHFLITNSQFSDLERMLQFLI